MLNLKVGNLIRVNSDVCAKRRPDAVYRVVRIGTRTFAAFRGWLTDNGAGWNSADARLHEFYLSDRHNFHLVAKDIYSLPPAPEPLTGSYDVHKTPSRPTFSCYEEELAFLLKDAPPLSGVPTRHAHGRDDCYDLEAGAIVKLSGDVLCEYSGDKTPEGSYIVHQLDGGGERLLWGSPDVCCVVHLPSREAAKDLSAREKALAELCKGAPVLPCGVSGGGGDAFLVLQAGDVVANRGRTVFHEYRGEKAEDGQYILYCLNSDYYASRDTWWGAVGVFQLVHRRAPRRAEVKPEVVALTPGTVELISEKEDVRDPQPKEEEQPPLADVFDCLTLKVGDVVRRLTSGLDICEQKGAPFKVVDVLPPNDGYVLQPILPEGSAQPSGTSITRMGSGLCWEKVTMENAVRAGTRLQVLPVRGLDVKDAATGDHDFLPQGTVVEVVVVDSPDSDHITVQTVNQDGTVDRTRTYRSLVRRNYLARRGYSFSYCLVRNSAASQVTGAPSGATSSPTSPVIVVQSSQASGNDKGCNFALGVSCATNTGAGSVLEFDLGQTTTPKRPVTANILTHSGQLLDVLNPDPKAIKIGDIAHALSQKVRWGGHSERPITIAEHSVRVARVARYLCGEAMYDKGAALRVELAALLHDAAEAYIGDVPKPIKNALPVWDNQIENPLQHAILKAFNCEVASLASENIIKLADQLVNQIELEAHMRGFWSLSQGQRAAASAYTGDRELLQRIAGDQSIFGYDFVRESPASVWESNFLYRFNELTKALAK